MSSIFGYPRSTRRHRAPSRPRMVFQNRLSEIFPLTGGRIFAVKLLPKLTHKQIHFSSFARLFYQVARSFPRLQW